MHNADVLFKEDSTVDDLIDVIEVRLCAGRFWLACAEHMATFKSAC